MKGSDCVLFLDTIPTFRNLPGRNEESKEIPHWGSQRLGRNLERTTPKHVIHTTV